MVANVLWIVLLVGVVSAESEKCLTPKNEDGTCVSLYTCPKVLEVLAKGQPNDQEYVRRSRCGATSSDPLVCCPTDTKQNCVTPDKKPGQCVSLGSCPHLIKLLEKQEPGSVEYVRKSSCKITTTDAIVCCPSQPTLEKVHDDERLIPSKKYCGYQHSDDYSSNVKSTDINDFPWLAGLKYRLRNGQEKVNCHGSIINPRYILTAAHCLDVPSYITLLSIRLGEYSIGNSTDCVEKSGFTECSEPVQEYGVEKIIIHPDYVKAPNTNADIALIRLNGTIEVYSDYIRPICLPLPGSQTPQLGDTVLTTGWGKTASGSNSDVKKKIFNMLISNEECLNIFRKISNTIKILDTQICTKELSDNVDFSCVGDSGGPVMFSHKSQWHIEGINSFGARQCGDKYPVVHTKVSTYINWIRENMTPWY